MKINAEEEKSETAVPYKTPKALRTFSGLQCPLTYLAVELCFSKSTWP